MKEPTSIVDVSNNIVIAALDHLSTRAELGEAWRAFLPLTKTDWWPVPSQRTLNSASFA